MIYDLEVHDEVIQVFDQFDLYRAGALNVPISVRIRDGIQLMVIVRVRVRVRVGASISVRTV